MLNAIFVAAVLSAYTPPVADKAEAFQQGKDCIERGVVDLSSETSLGAVYQEIGARCGGEFRLMWSTGGLSPEDKPMFDTFLKRQIASAYIEARQQEPVPALATR